MSRIDDPERALRLARAVVSDLLSYHPDLVQKGLLHDDLFERMASELAEAREYFEQRVEDDTARKTNAWNRALVDVLVYRSRHLRSRIW